MTSQQDLVVSSLGPCQHSSPIDIESASHPLACYFVQDDERILLDTIVRDQRGDHSVLSVERAGPREKLFFNPATTTAAIVTCGGLSPGLNNVIRCVFAELTENYGISSVLGIRNGYLGLNPDAGLEPIELTKEFVEPIDKLGGTALGSSRGPQDPGLMAEFLQSKGIDVLFCVGGDGTQRGAHDLYLELQRRGQQVSIVGIPKTIDNDIAFVHTSFGFATALEKAADVIRAAHVEARGAPNGIGLVKLMGRHSGFITAGATVVSQEVDFALVPEIPFPIDGEQGFLTALKHRIHRRGHAVIVVAEGAGQHLFQQQTQHRDASGNLQHEDIGLYLRDTIKQHFANVDVPINLKYIDPSYYIRSIPANVYDRILCDQMGRNAAHAAMAGKTGVMIGSVSDHTAHVPIPAVVSQTKEMDVAGDLWRSVMQVTGQPGW